MPSHHEIASEIARRIPEMARDGQINNATVIENIIREMLDAHAICIYCGASMDMNNPENREKMADHIMTCEKSPLVQMVAEASKLNQELIAKHNAITEIVSRFLVAHRDTHKTWIETFVECGAVTADFDYHPLYPFIAPVKL